ncbi:hypothetical protein [Psychroserpens sp. MEBiC05023]
MKSKLDPTYLLQTMTSIKVVKCAMHHESVLMDVNNQPIYKTQGASVVFNRVKLCNERASRLGCAHSGVNYKFENLLENLVMVYPKKRTVILNFKEKFKSIITAIYKLDHDMGQLEHELAVEKVNKRYRLIDELLVTKDKLKSNHRLLMEQLSDLKSEIEVFIKLEMNYNAI